jgi:hypothetical protein
MRISSQGAGIEPGRYFYRGILVFVDTNRYNSVQQLTVVKSIYYRILLVVSSVGISQN